MISIWEKETFFAPQDVIIVGSGFVGLWSAIYLKKKHPHLKITIIERGIIPTGASTRNAGFACFGSMSEVMHDIKLMGLDKTLALVEMRFRGLECIQQYFKNEKIDFDLCGGYELYDEFALPEKLDADADYLNSVLKEITGSKRTYKRFDEKIDSFGFGKTQHLVRNKLEGCLHSGKLIQALLRKAHKTGVQVLTNIEIRQFEQQHDHLLLQTNSNVQFSTNQLLICTNAFAKDLLPEEDVIPARGQVILTSPIKHLPWKGTFHSDEGFYYFRNLDNRVLLGGARNKAFNEEQTTDMQTSSLIQQELENYLADVILPHQQQNYTVEMRWAGIMGMGAEKMPIVKQIQPNVFCALRMSGMGVALAPIVGQQVADLML
jgi:glycine/D-amino acid oxidase-like deaminating enzyme